ncbi:MAG: polysaccharide biosynthesis/export protein [Chthoniobacter sp.]|jgi:polysaccharide export outer membrane protein|nr:polysaccharide biosynthesis/export protein [Chthoniobacter sp.]
MKFFVVLLGYVLVAALALGQVPREPASPADRQSNYVLVPNDLIDVKVFQEDDLTSRVRISKDGSVTLPLIGSVAVGGRTTQEAAHTIREMLAKDYLVNPQVNLTVIEYSKRRFTVLGQVNRPGAYEMPDRDSMGLLQAIGMAGGYTRIADPAKITLKRSVNGKDSVMKLNAKTMASQGAASGFEVQQGDIITVGESIF